MGKSVNVDIKTTIYPLEAIYAAAYQFIDRAYVRLEEKPKQVIRVCLDPKEDADPKAFKKIDGEFLNELVHQFVRTKVAESNKKIREYVVTRALLSAQSVQEIPAGFPVPGAPSPEGMLPGPDGIPNLGSDGQPVSGVQQGESPMVDQREDDPSPGANLDRVNRKAAPSDDALADEIQKLLSEIDSGGDAEDPLGITAPWEEQAAEKGKDAKAKGKTKRGKVKKVKAAKGGGKDALADEIKALLESEAGGGKSK
ncbi:MAG: His-Xaa-Ser system protein HxsD [Elusimicrobiota bacterium]